LIYKQKHLIYKFVVAVSYINNKEMVPKFDISKNQERSRIKIVLKKYRGNPTKYNIQWYTI